MKNFIQPGEVVSVPAPANVTSGQGVLVGSLFGVAGHDALSGAPLDLHTQGVVDLVKTASQAWTVGALIYWTGTACTNVAATNKLIGVAIKAVGGTAGETIGQVRLNGAGITA